MSTPVFEVVIDHNDPKHHDRMNAMLRDLQTWAKRHGVAQLQRETTELRPGVTRVRFTPARRATTPVAARDRLSLTHTRR